MVSPRPIPPWLRIAFGLPRHLYAHQLGWMLGRRFLQLDHAGRRNGREYHTVLEVMHYDPARREAVVMSGFGAGADWLRNIQASGHATVPIGATSYPAQFRILPVDEAETVLAGYERRTRLIRPVLHAVLSRLLGWPYDATPTARRRAVEQLP